MKMKINWKVRLKNKMFWVAAIPAMLLLVQQILAIFGVSIDTSLVSEQLLDIVNTAFLLLALIGVVTDPTTEGVADSKQALTYQAPKSEGE